MSANEPQTQVQTTAEAEHLVEGQHPVPPAGEEIHLPGGSVLPLVVAAAITLSVIGLTIWLVWTAVGAVIAVGAIVLWARDARREFEHLPDDVDAGH